MIQLNPNKRHQRLDLIGRFHIKGFKILLRRGVLKILFVL